MAWETQTIIEMQEDLFMLIIIVFVICDILSVILQDLLALKELEGFKLLECEEEHGRSTVTTPNGDVLTVETSLEDLEFGFKVVKSTQKVISQYLFKQCYCMTGYIDEQIEE